MRIDLTEVVARGKETLPTGKINVRFRQMRGVWQVFAGRQYLLCASGDTAEEALAELVRLYHVPDTFEAIVHNGYLSEVAHLSTTSPTTMG
jgi:hypothetical protein